MTNSSLWRTVASGTALLVLGAAAQAQTVYRTVGANGKVTFSDRPPVTAEQGKVVGVGVGASGAAPNASLPFELRQVASKFPVTLYTSAKCSPCDAGRALLTGRGVPFVERTVGTNEDAESLQRISGDTSLPLITIGGQKIRGFTDTEWVQYLDAAGYPKTSALPASYKNPATTPLVALQRPAPPSPASAKPEERSATPVPPPTPAKSADNPTGIVF